MGLIDSGADDCIFPSAIGRLLGLSVEAGKKQPFMGAGALSNLAYFHRVKLSFALDTTVFRFATWYLASGAGSFCVKQGSSKTCTRRFRLPAGGRAVTSLSFAMGDDAEHVLPEFPMRKR